MVGAPAGVGNARRPTRVQGVMEYFFGLGDGLVTTWHTDPSLDLGGTGLLDAVPLDFDGDGRADDALWDSDGDGVADVAVLDVGGAGEARYTDPAGLGTWSQPVPTGSPAQPLPPLPTGSAHLDVDGDGDGVPDTRLSDWDGDGYLDAAGPL